MNDRLSKIRSVHTYAMSRVFYLERYCILSSNQANKKDADVEYVMLLSFSPLISLVHFKISSLLLICIAHRSILEIFSFLNFLVADFDLTFRPKFLRPREAL